MIATKLIGPTFSWIVFVSMTATCLFTFFFTKLPLLVPVASGAIAVITGVMVARDIKSVWLPLLTSSQKH